MDFKENTGSFKKNPYHQRTVNVKVYTADLEKKKQIWGLLVKVVHINK